MSKSLCKLVAGTLPVNDLRNLCGGDLVGELILDLEGDLLRLLRLALEMVLGEDGAITLRPRRSEAGTLAMGCCLLRLLSRYSRKSRELLTLSPLALVASNL